MCLKYVRIADLIPRAGSPRARIPILPVIPKFQKHNNNNRSHTLLSPLNNIYQNKEIYFQVVKRRIKGKHLEAVMDNKGTNKCSWSQNMLS